jgi:hypothetical protein
LEPSIFLLFVLNAALLGGNTSSSFDAMRSVSLLADTARVAGPDDDTVGAAVPWSVAAGCWDAQANMNATAITTSGNRNFFIKSSSLMTFKLLANRKH